MNNFFPQCKPLSGRGFCFLRSWITRSVIALLIAGVHGANHLAAQPPTGASEDAETTSRIPALQRLEQNVLTLPSNPEEPGNLREPGLLPRVDDFNMDNSSLDDELSRMDEDEIEPPDLDVPLPELPPSSFEPDSAPPLPRETLIQVASAVAESVVMLRAWDGYGNQVGRASGVVLTTRGDVMTSTALFGAETDPGTSSIEFISAQTGSGQTSRVTGVTRFDQTTGICIVRIASSIGGPVNLAVEDVRSLKGRVFVVSFNEIRGLILADATAESADSLAFKGYIRLTGQDSPAVTGSAVLDQEGRLVAVVAYQIPMTPWVAYAAPASQGILQDILLSEDNPRVKIKDLESFDPFVGSRVSWERVPEVISSLYAGRIGRAGARLRQITEQYPRSASAWYLLGLTLEAGKRPDEALPAYERALALDESVGVYWRALARVAGGKDQPKEVLDEKVVPLLAEATRRQPGDVLAWVLRCRAELGVGQIEQGLESAQRISNLAPLYAPGHYFMAYALGKLQRLDAAARAARQSVALDRTSRNAWFLLGLILNANGDLEDAIAAYRAALRLDPAFESARSNLIAALIKKGRRTEARKEFEERKRLAKQNTSKRRQ